MIHYFESLFSQDSWLNGPIQLHGQKGRRVMVSDLLRSSLVSLLHLCYSDKSISEANFQRNAAELKRSSSADDTTPAPVPLTKEQMLQALTHMLRVPVLPDMHACFCESSFALCEIFIRMALH